MRDPNFTDVLDTACRSAGLDLEGDASAGSAGVLRSTAFQLQQLADRIIEPASRASLAANWLDSYLEHQSESPRPRASKPNDPQAVADELCITAEMTVSDLCRLRREFALANHPDRFDSVEREGATRRMMIANMLIDRELKRRHWPQLASER